MKRKETILKYKLLYTCLILFIYILGRAIPLYAIDRAAYTNEYMDAEGLLMQSIGGDAYRTSIFAIGVAPYMVSNLLVQVVMAIRKEITKAMISPRRTTMVSLVMTLILAAFQAFFHVEELKFTVTGDMLFMAKAVALLEMVAGVMVIAWLVGRNKKYGIGGQTAIILVNILDRIGTPFIGHELASLAIPLLISAVLLVIVVVMENAEKRIPVQRVSIHNIYADKNYMAIKLNPVGTMPVMFSSAFFSLAQLLVSLLAWLFPAHGGILWWKENMALTTPLGIAVYIVIVYALTIGFSMLFINPGDTMEQFLKSGDSIVDIHAGRDTKRYLTRSILKISFVSATVMGLCVGVPLILQLEGRIDSSLVMFPTSVMIMTGMWCNLFREVRAVRSYDAYQLSI